MEDGSLPYENNGEKRSWPGEIAPSKEVRKDAKFIGTDGKPHVWVAEALGSALKAHPECKPQWVEVKNTVAKYGERVVFAPFHEDLDKLKKYYAGKIKSLEQSTTAGLSRHEEIKLAQKHLQEWPTLKREALFADIAELLYTEDGSLPYKHNGKELSWPGEIALAKEPRMEAKFIGTDGKPHVWAEGRACAHDAHPEYQKQWVEVKNAIAKYGERVVFAPFHEELGKLKKYYAGKTKSLEQSATAGLSRHEEIKLAQKHLQEWPSLLREALFVDIAELHYMEDGSLPYANNGEKRSWPGEIAPSKQVRRHAKFIGTDGKPHACDEIAGNMQPEHHKQWVEVKNAVAKYGERVVFAPFLSDFDKIKKYHADKTKGQEKNQREEAEHTQREGAEHTQREEAERAHALKNADKYTENILKSMGKLKEGSRMAILACLQENIPLQNALSHSYADSAGSLRFVFETLQGEGNLNESLEILDKAGQVEEIRGKVLDKLAKRVKTLQKGATLRSFHIDAAQKQYEVYLALTDAQASGEDNASNEGKILADTMEMIDKTQAPLYRMVLLCIICEKMQVEDLFSKIVLDTRHAPHTCFDVLSETNHLDQALQLMANLDASVNLRKDLASLYSSEYERLEHELKKRESLIVLTFKQYKAKEARDNLKELQK